ncbi:hypothetical protein GCM10022223_46780 [Kineosporia mesophila]|uniref:Uncharacterized protein n=1 Tax=Kineosporia mesophila TaxID=566012 RepID=A0ABP7A3T8_9ACTN|nr:hypothetical protein [Kineosporia mesophila]MCD5353789.1 hypothetical protein [Kineosporia mesophila]
MSDSENIHLSEIGRLAILAGSIERHMADLTALLVSPDSSEVGYTVVKRQQFSGLAQLANQVLINRLKNPDSRYFDLLDPISKWITDARKVMQWRNQLLHATWMFYPISSQALILRRGGETEDISIEKIRGYVAIAEKVDLRGGKLWEEFLDRCGHLDALIEATKRIDPDWFGE